jgi:hypothetical protein
VVVKVPHDKDEYIDNRKEAAAWKKYRTKPTSFDVYVAPHCLLSDGCLMLVSVDSENVDYGSLLAWAAMYKGNLVAYDFALDVKR